jgi:hypothetical protein
VSRTYKVSAIHVETQTLEFALVAVTSSDPQDILHMELKWSTLDKKGATSVCSREMESKTASHTNEAMQQQQQQVQQQQEAQEQEGRFGTKASTAAPAGQKFKTLHKNSMPKNAQSDKNPMQLQCTRHEQKQKKKQNPANRKRRSAKGQQKSQKQQKTPPLPQK